MISRWLVLFALLLANLPLFSQQAVVRKSANLRPQPDGSVAPEGQVSVGDKLTVLDPTPEHGYYQVKTASGQDGWVFGRYIKILASPSSSDPGIQTEASVQRERSVTILCGSTSTTRSA